MKNTDYLKLVVDTICTHGHRDIPAFQEAVSDAQLYRQRWGSERWMSEDYINCVCQSVSEKLRLGLAQFANTQWFDERVHLEYEALYHRFLEVKM